MLIIVGKITTAIGALVPILAGLAPVFTAVGTAIMAIIAGPAAPFILVGAAIAGLVLIWKNFGDDIKAIVSDLVEGIGLLMYPFIDFFVGVFTTIADSVMWVFEKMWAGIKQIINWIIDGVNIMVKGLNKISVDVPSWVPGIGGNKFGFDMAEIPHLAEGGNITQPGSVLVGERGPEVLSLPKGAQVTPLNHGKPIQVTNNFYSPKELDEYEVTRRTESTFRKLEFEYARRF